MFFGYNSNYPMWTALITLLILVASVAVPYYGYKKKRWKGLTIGCLLQPVVCFVVLIAIILGIYSYEYFRHKKQKEHAMVTVKTLEKKGDRVDTLYWYVKSDEECIMERKRQGHGDENDEDRDSTDTERDIEWFDVVPIDNFPHGVNVEDRIMVRFDLKNQSVVANDYDARAEVTNVDWDQVRDFFNKK
jgi:uncharacterized membrane protein